MSFRLLLALVIGLTYALPTAAQPYVPGYERGIGIATGAEVVLVYFGASTYGPCRSAEFKAALDRAKVLLAERAEREGKAFVAVGVALDDSVEEGLAFLAEAGRFDELVIGHSWLNSAALTHIWHPEGLSERSPALPGVTVFAQDVVLGEAGIAAGDPTYLVELLDARTIMEWVDAGAPLE